MNSLLNINYNNVPHVSLACLKFSSQIGEVVQKPAWGKDQPNNYNGEQNCVVLDGGRNWLWNDVGCNLDYLHFICQHGTIYILLLLLLFFINYISIVELCGCF